MENLRIAPVAELPQPAQKLRLDCSACGYGAVCAAPPERCPMCGREGAWTHAPWRPFSRPRFPVASEAVVGAQPQASSGVRT